MSIENKESQLPYRPPYGGRLYLPDGTLWIGDESSGHAEGEEPSKGPLNSRKVEPEEHPYPGVFGMGTAPQKE